MGATGDGWEVPKRRRRRKPAAMPRDVGKVGSGKADGRSREEVLADFERARARWEREWEGLPCRENLRRVLGRVRADLKIGADACARSTAAGEGLEERMASVSIGEGADSEAPAGDGRARAPDGQERKDAPRAWPRRASGLSCAVCLGLGSFEDEGWEVVRRTWVQYFAFLAIVEALGELPSPSPSPPLPKKPFLP